MNNKYIEMRQYMMKQGYPVEYIKEIISLEKRFNADCEEIAIQCMEEGYPSHGENYELRYEALKSWYDEQMEIVDKEYGF